MKEAPNTNTNKNPLNRRTFLLGALSALVPTASFSTIDPTKEIENNEMDNIINRYNTLLNKYIKKNNKFLESTHKLLKENYLTFDDFKSIYDSWTTDVYDNFNSMYLLTINYRKKLLQLPSQSGLSNSYL